MKTMKTVSYRILVMVVLSLSACHQESSAALDEWITLDDRVDMSSMNLFWQHDNIQFVADENAKLSIYVNAEKNEDGKFILDDGQEWLILLETALGNYSLFPRKYVQLGGVSCDVFNEYIDNDTISHVVVTVRQTAGYKIYDCVFDSDKSAFKVTPVYDARGINYIADSNNS